MRKTGRVWERGRHVGGKVGSKLQKKLIKNEKKKGNGGRMEGRRGEAGVDGSSGGWMGRRGGGVREENRQKKKKEGKV